MGSIIKHICQYKNYTGFEHTHFHIFKKHLQKNGVNRENVLSWLYGCNTFVTTNSPLAWSIVFSDVYEQIPQIISSNPKLFHWDYVDLDQMLNTNELNFNHVTELFYKRYFELISGYKNNILIDRDAFFLSGLRIMDVGQEDSRYYLSFDEICIRIFDIQLKGFWSYKNREAVFELIEKQADVNLLKEHYKEFIDWQIFISNKVQKFASYVECFPPDEFVKAVREIELTDKELEKLSIRPATALFVQHLKNEQDYSKMYEERIKKLSVLNLSPV